MLALGRVNHLAMAGPPKFVVQAFEAKNQTEAQFPPAKLS